MCNNRCFGCQNIVLVTEVLDAETYLQLTVPSENLCNNDRICFVIPSNLTLSDTPKPVLISIGSELFVWLSKSGNFVYSDQIRNRKLYVGRVKTDSRVFLNERCNLFRTSFDLPVLPLTETTRKVNLIVDKITENKGSDKK